MPYFKNITLNDIFTYDYVTLYTLVEEREKFLQKEVNRRNEAAEEMKEQMEGGF